MEIIKRYLAFAFIFASFQAIAQQRIPDEIPVSYQAESKTVKQVITDLSAKTGITIAYQDEIIPSDSLISITVRRKQLGLILDQILKPSGVKYKIVGNQIVLINDIYKSKSKTNKGNKDEHTIYGYLKDSESGEALVQANVFLFDRSKGTTTNEYGFYSFTVPKGTKRIYFSYAGYQQGINEIKLTNDTELNVELDPYIMLNEVVITDLRISDVEEEPVSQNVLALDRMNSMLPLGGEPDVMRLSHFMPGVSSGADGFGGMSVRGGSVDQNLILLDGVPVYNANHALGLYSIFNSHIIKSAKLIKGSFPAKYGGMLSSVLDIRTREGSKKSFRGDIGLGVLAAKASFEGPIGRNSSYLFSARRTFSDIWISSVTKYLNDQQDKEGSTAYYFYDLNAKLNFGLGARNRFFVSIYNGKDKFDNEVSFDRPVDDIRLVDYDELLWNWQNTVISGRLNTQLSKKAFLNTTFYSSQYNYKTFDQDRYEQYDVEDNLIQELYSAGLYSSGIKDLGFRMDFDFIPSTKHIIRTGFNFILHEFTPGLTIVNQSDELVSSGEKLTIEVLDQDLNEDKIKGKEIQLFFEDAIAMGKYSKLSLGFHQSFIMSDLKNYSLPQPRIAFITDKKSFSFKTGISFVSQYMHLLTNNGLGVPADVWLPSTDEVKPQKAWIANMGFKKGFKNDFGIGLELFYKDMQQLVEFGEGGFLKINDIEEWDKEVPEGKGTSYGVELTADKTIGKYSWLLNYTWSKSTRHFEDINNGFEYLYRFDRRHALKTSVLYRINDNTEFSLNWVFSSGNPISLPTDVTIKSDVDGNPFFLAIFPERNNATLPYYHRLDLGFNFYNKLKYGRQKFSIGIYNAYNRTNPYYFDVIQDDVTVNAFDLNSVSILPFLPTISYSLSFN